MKLKILIPVFVVLNLVFIGLIVYGVYQKNQEGQITRFVDYDIVEVFHDQGYIYMDPLMPSRDDDVTLRVRTFRGNVTKAEIRYTFDIDSSEKTFHTADMAFEKVDETGEYEYWVGVIPKQNNPFTYYFRLENEKEFINYNAAGYSNPDEDFSSYNGNFLVKPGFHVPEWAQGALWYSIMPDSFYNGDITNDKLFQSRVIQNPWGNSHFHGNDYFGGDLAGLEQKIDYFERIGATSLQLNPIWISTHQAGYGAYDFSQIDSAFGNSTMLKELTKALHAQDIKITLDGVFNYFNENGVWYNRYDAYPLPGAVNPNDPYYSLYMRDEYNNIIRSWGSPEIDFSSPLTRELIYAASDSILQTYYDEYEIDGFRLDVGEALRGSDPDNWGDAEQIIRDMRKYIKAIDEDKLLMSEHGHGALLFDYILDTKWNYGFGWPVRDWAAGISNNVVLQARLNNEINRIPRPMANASYNFLTTHDEARILNFVDNDHVAVNAAQLLQMTYIGAPSVYFGDEIGMLSNANPGVGQKAPTSFDSFNWNESTWNYDIFNFHMALANLRQDYEKVFKDGAYMALTVDSDIFSYGRWNEGGKVITAINNSHDVLKDVELEARQLSIPNGTVLTDYLTGKTYEVKDGFVTIDVMPGGAVLVDGDATGNYRGTFEINEATSLTLQRQGLSDYTVSGTGELSDGLFAHRPGFNNVSLGARYETQDRGRAALMMQDDESPQGAFYAVEIDDEGRFSIRYRQTRDGDIEQGVTGQLTDGQEIRIMRHSNNRFSFHVKDNEAWVEIDGSNHYVDMDERIDLGLVPLEGTFDFKDVRVETLQEQRAETFDDGFGSMFGRDGVDYVLENDRLKLLGSEESSLMLTQAPLKDFTIRTTLIEQPTEEGAYAGLVVAQDEMNQIVAGRIMLDGEAKLFIGRVTNGELVIFDTVSDTFDQIDVRLEKVGAEYQLYYEEEGVFKALDARINANYSNLRAGLVTKGEDAIFDDFAFGNALEDGLSIADYGFVGELDYDYLSNTHVFNEQRYATTGGSWEYTFGGMRQTDVTAEEHILSYDAATYREFKSDFTWDFHEIGEEGFIAYQFAYNTQNPALDRGYVLKLDGEGVVSLIRQGDVVGTYEIEDFSSEGDYRFVVEVQDGMVRIYYGLTPMPIIIDENYTSATTRMRHVGKFVDYALISPNVFNYAPNWLLGRGNLSVVDEQIDLQVVNEENPYHFSYLMAEGVTNVMVASNVKLQKLSMARAEFGVVIGGTVGSHPLVDGLLVGANEFGDIFIREEGEVLASINRDDIDVRSFYMIIVVQDQTIKVYVERETEPTLVYEDDRTRGGVLGFYTDSANVSLNYFDVHALTDSEDYTVLDGYATRRIDNPPAPNPTVGEDLVTEDMSFDLTDPITLGEFNRYNGNWQITDDEELWINSGAGNWYAGATIAAGKFKDFELSYQVRAEGNGFGGVIIRKQNFNDNHEVSGLLLYKNINTRGVVAYSGIEYFPIDQIAIDDEGFAHIVIRAVGNMLEVTAGDGVNMSTWTYDMDEAGRVIDDTGYISLISGSATSTFRDISVRILDEEGNYVN